MLFFGKKSKSSTKDKNGTSTLGAVGSLFNPHIGSTIRPLGETGKMLVSIIALIFAAHGLFPRNHPALLGVSGARLTLAEVISTGWRNLKFNPEKPLPALVFIAVLASLGCSMLALAAGLFSILIGTAHAQVPPTGIAMFAQQPTDVACGWINWLFGTTTYGCALQDYIAQFGTDQMGNSQTIANLQSTSIQQALVGALAFYSDVILVIAAVVLFYHLTSMIVETAHHGVAMGRRANQVWAPIRLVVAVGLLVPIAAGLNSGQFIVLQIVQWGGAVASNAWTFFLEEMIANDANSTAFVPPLAADGRKIVADIVLMEACTQAYNDLNKRMNTDNPNIGLNPIPAKPAGVYATGNADSDQKFAFTPAPNQETQQKELCGYYILKQPTPLSGVASQLAKDIYADEQTAFNQMLTDATAFAVQNVPFAEKGINPQQGSSAWPVNDGFETLIFNYQGYMQTSFTNVLNGLTSTMATVAQTSMQFGWVGAGAWWNTIARIQGDIGDLAHNIPYTTSPPHLEEVVTKFNRGPGTVEGKLNIVMNDFKAWLDKETNSAIPGNGGNLSAQQYQLLIAQAGMMQEDGDKKPQAMDLIFEFVDVVAGRNGVWKQAVSQDKCAQGTGATSASACFSLGVQFTSYDPLAEIAAFGHANISTAYDIFDDYIFLLGIVGGLGDMKGVADALTHGKFTGGALLAKIFGGVAGGAAAVGGAVGDVIGMIVVVFFTAGFMLAFFLPLIPFYRFMFGTLAWFLSLLEAIVAVPLVALAHLTPEGEGFMGDKAKQAYYFIFNLFLKPVLMIFGLICGFLIFDIAASLLNLLYSTAVAGAGGIGNGHYSLARIVFSIIYVVILYISCNKCFQLIEWLPEHAIKWMGAQGLHTAPMGDPNEVAGYMGIASAMVEQRIVAGAGAIMKSPAGPAILGGLMSSGSPVATSMGDAAGRIRGALPTMPGFGGGTGGDSLAATLARSQVGARASQLAGPNGDPATKMQQAEQEYQQNNGVSNEQMRIYFPGYQPPR